MQIRQNVFRPFYNFPRPVYVVAASDADKILFPNPGFLSAYAEGLPFWTSRAEGSMLYIPISYFSTSSPDLSQECQEPDPRRSHPDPAHSGGREGGKVVSARQRRARTAARIRRTKISAKRGIKISINTTYSSNNYTTIALHYEHVKVICFASNSSNTITIRISMHCCCSSVSCRGRLARTRWQSHRGRMWPGGLGQQRRSRFFDSIREAGFGWIEDQTKTG